MDLYSVEAGRGLDAGRRGEMGQFPTPPAVARFMASMLELRGRSVRLLDAGAGVGVLTAAVVQEAVGRAGGPGEIRADAYELDGALEVRLRTTLDACRAEADRKGMAFVGRSLREDFVRAGAAGLRGEMFAPEPGSFDCAILNPPYRKLARGYLRTAQTLSKQYAQKRRMQRIPLSLPSGEGITLSPGGQNVLVKEIVEQFCPRYTPGGVPLYIGDTDEKWLYFKEEQLRDLGVTIEEHGKMPDVVVHHVEKGWLVLIEAVTSHGPVGPKRRGELRELFAGSRAGLVLVTAFADRSAMGRYLSEIAWETEVWVADAPDHVIHFNGERFLGPYE